MDQNSKKKKNAFSERCFLSSSLHKTLKRRKSICNFCAVVKMVRRKKILFQTVDRGNYSYRKELSNINLKLMIHFFSSITIVLGHQELVFNAFFRNEAAISFLIGYHFFIVHVFFPPLFR